MSRRLVISFFGVAAVALTQKACGGTTDITIGADPAASTSTPKPLAEAGPSPSVNPPPLPGDAAARTDATTISPTDGAPPPPPPPPCNPTTDVTCVAPPYATELSGNSGRVECLSADTADPAQVEIRCTFNYVLPGGANAAFVAFGPRVNGTSVLDGASPLFLECTAGPSPVVCPPKVVPRVVMDSKGGGTSIFAGINTIVPATPTINRLGRLRRNLPGY